MAEAGGDGLACEARPAAGPDGGVSSSTPGGPVPGTRAGPGTELLLEEQLAAVLLAAMVALMCLQAVARNLGPLTRSALALWLAHATEILPSGLTWLTFLGCGAVTRRRSLLRTEVLRQRLSRRGREVLDLATWIAWAVFFALLLVLGCVATYSQRRQMTSIAWLPAWAVSLSVPVGSALVLWRTWQNLREFRRAPGPAPGDPARAVSGPHPGGAPWTR